MILYTLSTKENIAIVKRIIRLLQKGNHSNGNTLSIYLIYLNVIVGNDNARPWITSNLPIINGKEILSRISKGIYCSYVIEKYGLCKSV